MRNKRVRRKRKEGKKRSFLLVLKPGQWVRSLRSIRMNSLRWLEVSLVFLAAWFIAENFLSAPELGEVEPFVQYEAVSLPAEIPSVPFSKFAEALRGRQLFKPAVPVGTAASSQMTAEKLAERLTLVGIVRSGDAFEAYITVQNEGTSRYKVGDKVADFTVIDITKSKVTLELAGQLVELRF